MKKKLLKQLVFVSLISMIPCSVATAQNEKPQNEKNVHVGIEAYYGFPNLFSDIVEGAYQTRFQYIDYNMRDLGPTGIRAEFFINKHIAFGLDASYSTTELKWLREYAPTYNYTYRVEVSRLRILSKFNAHFGASKYFDWYAGAGVGYNSSEITLTTDDPNESYRQENRFPFATLPFCMRICTGGKYYFVKNMGIGFEFGLGGPLLSLGLNGRF